MDVRVGLWRRLSAEELMLLNCSVGEDSLRVPWTARRSNQSILKEISPGISLDGMMLKLKLQYFGHLMWRVYPNPRPLSRWRHPAISSSVDLFSFCLQSFPASGSFPMSHLYTSGGQITEASAWASVLPMSIHSWFPLRVIGLISLLSKGFSRVFSSTTVGKHQFFGTHPSLWSNSHIWSVLVLQNHCR